MGIFNKQNTPDLTENEWNAFHAAFNGHACHSDINEEVDVLHWTILEGYKHDSQVSGFIGDEKKLKIFVEKIKGWSNQEKAVVIHKANLFWNKHISIEGVY